MHEHVAIFVCVNIAYLLFEREALSQADAVVVPERIRRQASALVAPLPGFVLICSALVPYLRPDPPSIRH